MKRCSCHLLIVGGNSHTLPMLHKEFTPTLRSLRRDFNAVATNLRLVEGVDAGEHLALEELEGGAAAGGDVRHLVGEAGLLNRRDGVAAADDGDAVELREGVGDAITTGEDEPARG